MSTQPLDPAEVYAVTPDGMLDSSGWVVAYVFLQPEHHWRAEWHPEKAGQVRLVRADNPSRMHHWVSAPGLLGVRAHAVNSRSRVVKHTELRAAAAEIAEQIGRCLPDMGAVVELPRGFTVDIVPPALVFGSWQARIDGLNALAR